MVTVIGAQAGERDRPAAWLDPEYGVVRFVAREAADPGSRVHRRLVFRPSAARGRAVLPVSPGDVPLRQALVRLLVRSLAANTEPPDALFDPAALGRR